MINHYVVLEKRLKYFECYGWFLAIRFEGYTEEWYLHTDGQLRRTTVNENNEYTGFFYSRQFAVETYEEWVKAGGVLGMNAWFNAEEKTRMSGHLTRSKEVTKLIDAGLCAITGRDYYKDARILNNVLYVTNKDRLQLVNLLSDLMGRD